MLRIGLLWQLLIPSFGGAKLIRKMVHLSFGYIIPSINIKYPLFQSWSFFFKFVHCICLMFFLKECQEIVREVTHVSMLMKTLQTGDDLFEQTQLISEATALLSSVISLSSCSSKSQRYGSYIV